MQLLTLFSLDDEAFIKAVYRLLLGREADPSGLSKYAKDLANGRTKASIVVDIARSDEATKNQTLAGLHPEDSALLEQFDTIRTKIKQPPLQFSRRRRLIERLDTLDSLIGAIASSLSDLRHTAAAPTDPIIYCARITGGLGDALIIARFLRDFQRHIAAPAQFDIYFHSPETVRPFFSKLPGFRAILHEKNFPQFVERYDFALLTNQFLTFSNEHIKIARLIQRAPRVLECHEHIEQVRRPIEKYIINHPHLDGAFANLATKAGHKRFTYLHHMAGIPYGGDQLDIDLPQRPLPAPLASKPFITVHDGWDTKFDFQTTVDRPTKSLPPQTWNDVVNHLRTHYPNHTIVQLGSNTGSEIAGVDASFKGKLSFDESLAILSASALHVDTESGLVHIATALGVPCAVFFGPTNPDWFSYKQNINLSPTQCGDCWWSTPTWMALCPIGHPTPLCMSTHNATNLITQVEARWHLRLHVTGAPRATGDRTAASSAPPDTAALRTRGFGLPIDQ